ncbi:ESX secretion-associated protein EspG [Mycobacterium haemophilum]
MSTVAAGARLSTTSEGLWLVAALAGVSRLPAVLKVRPVGDVDGMVADHPGLAVLEDAGIYRGGVLDPDVADWLLTLGRPDIELDIMVSRPNGSSDLLVGPPNVFEAPQDSVAAAEALSRWHAQQPPQRAAALCRRKNWWVAAARMWHEGEDPIDEVVVSPLGQTSPVDAVNDILGPGTAAQFHGINIESAVLESIINDWQAHPDTDVVTALVEAGLTVPQARIVAAVGDGTATRAVVTAVEYSIDGASPPVAGISVVDTLVGRVVISTCEGPDERGWTMLFAGTAQRVATGIEELLARLPSGRDWTTHERIQKFDTR